MTPRRSIDDPADRVFSHAKGRRQGRAWFTLRRPPSYLVYLFGVQLLAAPRTLPPLPQGIVHVGFLRAEKEMTGVDATRVIAAMQDTQTRWDLAAGGQPRQPMRPNPEAAIGEVPIAARGHIPEKRPAAFRISSVDKRPESGQHICPQRRTLAQLGELPIETVTNTERYVNFFRQLFSLCQDWTCGSVFCGVYPNCQGGVPSRH